MKKQIIPFAGLLLLADGTHATTTDVGAGLGTLGGQLTFTNTMDEEYALRLQVNGFKYNYEFKESGVTYEGDLKLVSAGVLGDWHPWKSDFRFTLGAYYNGSQMDADAKASNGTISINGTAYDVNTIGGLEADLNVKEFSPYIGLGFGGVLGESRFLYSFDIGVLYQGKPDIGLKTTKSVNDATLAANIEAQRKKLEDELKTFRWYPVVGFAIHYPF
ncbi:hypothetical protein [Endozoicomonas montiporae]|uniref:Outer membrane protein domain-containing protein n=1 Tax=Endozoicomonas montiporae CL-33 TaxID=570277 RepID=A0A142B7W2_9GAMM|nr:hypothetical protein [Endozoicomonas montiporae]AMO54838.1 outer membrane protein domain-containing protein [Endozoicomonas montiporae CL-33]